jgi:iron complex outermembrane receptor protein
MFKTHLPLVILTLLLFTLPVFSQTQSGCIKGTIITADGKPVPHATVILKKTNITTFSNDDGTFLFGHLPLLKDTLEISAIGLNLFKKEVEVGPGEMNNLGLIKLAEKVTQLQTVEVTGRSVPSYKSDYSFFGNKTKMPVIDIPQSVTAITKEVLQDKMEFTLKDALEEVAGLNQYSGYDEYAIRGFHADNAHDINGLRSYNTTYTSSMLVNIERIELIKGPTSTLYGNCDPGGTINLVTKKPLDKTEGDIEVYGGSWNHFRIQADVTGPVNSSKTLLYRFNAGFDTTKSFRNGFYAKSFELAPSFSYIPNDKFLVNFDFSVSHINTVLDRGQPGFYNDLSLNATPVSLSLTQPGDFLHETDVASILTASYKINKDLSLTSGYLNYNTQQRVADHGLNNYITADSVSLYYTTWTYHTVTNTLTSYLTYKFKTGKITHQLLAGYDYVRSTVTLNQQYDELPQFGTGNGIVGTFSLKNPQYLPQPVSTYQVSDFDNDATDVDDAIYHTQGIYVQDQFDYHKFKILFSLREEFYKGDDTTGGQKNNVLLPRIGIVYPLMPNLNIYATYNNGFDPFEASTSVQVFNAPFKPVTSSLLESGLKGTFFNNKLTASLAIYQLTLHNVAVNANDINNPNLFVQQGEDQSKGAELEVTGDILPNLSVSLFYSYCDARVIKSEVPSQVGMRVENSPLNSTGSWIKYTFYRGALKGLGLMAGHSSEGMRTTLDPGTNLPGYLIFKGGVQYHFHQYTAAVTANNITNVTYWTGAYNNVYKWPGQPRNLLFNLAYKF